MSTITIPRALLEQALEALWFANARDFFGSQTIEKAIASLQAALEQQAEPKVPTDSEELAYAAGWRAAHHAYARGWIAAPQRNMTDEEIAKKLASIDFAALSKAQDECPAVKWAKNGLKQEQKCECGERAASECGEPWGPECDLGHNKAYARRAVLTPEQQALLDDALKQKEPSARWEDQRVQAVYEVLVSFDPPPPEQHWEGWTARRIVDRLAALAQQEQEQEQYKLRIRATNKSLTMPTAQIVSVTKSGTTTGTFVTEMPHKLVPGDLAVYYGPSDTAHDGDQDQEPLCKGIPRRGCNYLAPCDTVCNKCGEIHHHHQMVAQFQAAQEEQEPVAWYDGRKFYGSQEAASLDCADMAALMPLYTHPPRREWQSLTEEEIVKFADEVSGEEHSVEDFARAIEQALKERNNG